MNIVFRVDSSAKIGTGHLMRCLSLANYLKKYGVKIFFVSRCLDGNLNDLVEKNDHILLELPHLTPDSKLLGYESWLTVKKEIDAKETIEIIQNILPIHCLIVDSYAIDFKWEEILNDYAHKTMVIDDLANRRHLCDILLENAYYPKQEERYTHLVPEYCKVYLGPEYLILREEFYQQRKFIRKRTGKVKNILVFFGGSDPTQETEKVLQAIRIINWKDIIFHVVVGGSNLRSSSIRNKCQNLTNVRYYYQVNYMASLMNKADLAIGAVGTSIWERCFLGLPSMLVAVAENQKQYISLLKENKLFYYLGDARDTSAEYFADVLKKVLNDEIKLNDITEIKDRFIPNKNKVLYMINDILRE